MISPYDTLSLQEAALMLNCGKSTLNNLLVDRDVSIRPPGAKIGKAWVFIRMDIVEYIRTRYSSNLQMAQDEQLERKTKCQSKSAKVRLTTISDSNTKEEEYMKALEPHQKRKLKK